VQRAFLEGKGGTSRRQVGQGLLQLGHVSSPELGSGFDFLQQVTKEGCSQGRLGSVTLRKDLMAFTLPSRLRQWIRER
jgi:hypothetical protein